MKTNIYKNVIDLNEYNPNLEEVITLQNKIEQWREEAKKVQSYFDFILPNYIIDEIIENSDSIKYNYENLYCLINCAIINGRITKENGILIKQIY